MIGKQKTTTTTKHSEWHHRFSLLWSNHHLLEDGSTKLVSLQGSNFTSSHCDTLFKATCHVVVCFFFFYAPCRSQSNPHAPDNLHSPITADVLPPSRLTSSLRWMMMVQLSPGWGASSWREAALQRVELALEEEERGGGGWREGWRAGSADSLLSSTRPVTDSNCSTGEDDLARMSSPRAWSSTHLYCFPWDEHKKQD